MKVYMMIGLPGSGKSTRTNQIWEGLEDDVSFAKHSTDDYMMIDGEYEFQPRKLGYYHRLNLEAFQKSVDNGVECIVVDNTNIKARDRKPYVQYAEENGYEVIYEVVGEFTEEFARVCAKRNTHGVPLEAILKMARRIQLPENT